MSDEAAAFGLRRALDRSAPALLAIPEADAARARAPGKWSAKQVIGHLIDSASTNHDRFVRARHQDDLIFPGYPQELWVEAQRYQDRPWSELVELWRSLNLHLAWVMDSTPEEERDRPRARHNLDQIGFCSLASPRQATLGFLMEDYVAHLEHHLEQVLGPGAAAPEA